MITTLSWLEGDLRKTSSFVNALESDDWFEDYETFFEPYLKTKWINALIFNLSDWKSQPDGRTLTNTHTRIYQRTQRLTEIKKKKKSAFLHFCHLNGEKNFKLGSSPRPCLAHGFQVPTKFKLNWFRILVSRS